MTWRPKTYEDHLLAGGENTLNGQKGSVYSNNSQPMLRMLATHPDRWYAPCPCSPRLRSAFMLVDCRSIDASIIVQDWACDTCWTRWLAESGKVGLILEEFKNQNRNSSEDTIAAFHQHAKPLTFRDVRSLNPRANRGEVSDLANELKGNGFVIKTVRKHCFTRSQWIEMQGGPAELIERFRGTQQDYR